MFVPSVLSQQIDLYREIHGRCCQWPILVMYVGGWFDLVLCILSPFPVTIRQTASLRYQIKKHVSMLLIQYLDYCCYLNCISVFHFLPRPHNHSLLLMASFLTGKSEKKWL